MTFLYHHSTST